MLDSTQRASPFHPLENQRVNTSNYSNHSTLQSFATRFSAAVSSPSEQKAASNRSGVSSPPELGRSVSVMARAHRMLAPISPGNSASGAPAGPKDTRDATSDLAGQVTASGAPSVVRLTIPI